MASTKHPVAPLKRRPRVLLTADTLGGVWTFVLDLAKFIGERGGETLIATMGRALDPSQRREVRRIPGCTLCQSTYKLEWMPEPWDDVDAASLWLRELEEQWSPDVIHCNTLAHAALGWKAPVVLTVHSCVYSWFQAVKAKRPPRREWREYRARVAASLRVADRVVAPTDALRTALDAYGPVRETIEVIHNGRPSNRFRRARQKRHHILAAGRLWDEGKNVALLARAVPHLRWPCLLAGECDERTPAARSPTLRLLGRLPTQKMQQHFAEAAVFAHPALYEPFGLAPLEAGLSGCALVLGDIPSLREVWGRDNALFVDPVDLEGLVSALQWLTTDPHRWRQYGERARARALQFPADRMCGQYWQIYRELLEGASRQVLTA